MEEMENFPQDKVIIETIILKPRFDQNKVKTKVEKLKKGFFSKFGVLKPRDEDITIIALNKYYEPFVVIGGKYSIDYCRKHDYAIRIQNETQQISIAGQKFIPETLAHEKRKKMIRIVGEEYSSYQTETYLVLDRTLQEISPEKLPLAPSDYEMEKQQNPILNLRKTEILLEEGIAQLRSKIAIRPSDAAAVVEEVFEITSRIVVFKPSYELILHNAKDGRRLTALVDGITGEIDLEKTDHSSKKLLDESSKSSNQNLPRNRIPLSPREPKQFPAQNSIFSSNAVADESGKDSKTEEKPEAPIGTSEPSDLSPLNAENATFLAVDFLRTLGYQHNLKPARLSRIGEDYTIEIGFEKGIAKIQVDAKTKKVKEYELEADGKIL